MSDLLQEAARALREESNELPAAPDLTKARILLSLRQQRKRSRTLLLLPLAAVVLGSTALAASGEMPRVARAVGSVLGLSQPGVSEATSQPPAGPVESPKPTALNEPSAREQAPDTVASKPDLSGAKQEVAADAREAVLPKPSSTSHTSDSKALAPRAGALPLSGSLLGSQSKPRSGDMDASPPKVTPAPGAITDITPEADALYRQAHQLHFGAQSPAAALQAWDEYLQKAPHGRFVLEASYNRALCLVRLGRAAEAKTALQPFAEGHYGSYRQQEAQRLIEAL